MHSDAWYLGTSAAPCEPISRSMTGSATRWSMDGFEDFNRCVRLALGFRFASPLASGCSSPDREQRRSQRRRCPMVTVHLR
jgi:hypothetical protein